MQLSHNWTALRRTKHRCRVLRQGLETVRQGELTLMLYYDEVEKRLPLVPNKIVLTYKPNSAVLFNNEVRNEALQAFISGVRKPLRAIVFILSLGFS